MTESVERFTSNTDADGEFLLTIYRDHHGVTRTVAWRQDPADTWGPEHILFAVPASVAGDVA